MTTRFGRRGRWARRNWGGCSSRSCRSSGTAGGPAREITEALNETEPVAHSTVQTLLRQLEAKGAVGHEARDRTFVFFPRLKEDRVKRTAARDCWTVSSAATWAAWSPTC